MKLEKLIAASYSAEAAKAWKAYLPSDADKRKLEAIGLDLLKNLPPIPGTCALMSAVYAARMQSVATAPVYVVAGTLSVRGVAVFGDGRPFDGKSVFSESTSSWDGHAWVMLGYYVADVSIFRTAYSAGSPPLLATHVRQEFGQGRGLLIIKWHDAPLSGLNYAPQYVVTDDQITGLCRGAMARFAPTNSVPPA
jgi:hypothetical protein